MNKKIKAYYCQVIFVMMHSIKVMSFCVLVLLSFGAHAQIKIEVLDTNTFLLGEGVVLSKTSFRGLSVVNDRSIWVAGSRGTIARSSDGGKTFTYSQIKGYEKSDFRDVEAFDDDHAIVMSSGTPAVMLKTTDGGQNWKEVFRRNDSAYFLDAMDFWDERRGVVVGDPINGHFVVLRTRDGGETWQELDTAKTPAAAKDEAIFAASGTSLRCWGKNEFGFVSGGSRSSVYTANIKKMKWNNTPTGLTTHGQGGFSFCMVNKGYMVVGGDYMRDKDTTIFNFAYINPDTTEWTAYSMQERLVGYKSCVELIETKPGAMVSAVVLATGTSGTQVGFYGWKGHSNGFWFRPNDPVAFHVARKAKKGKAVFLAGPNGRIGRLVY